MKQRKRATNCMPHRDDEYCINHTRIEAFGEGQDINPTDSACAALVERQMRKENTTYKKMTARMWVCQV